MNKWILCGLLASIGILFVVLVVNKSKIVLIPNKLSISLPTSTPTPKIYKAIEYYLPPIIPNLPSYTLIFIGDSMTESLGENFDALRVDLKKYYPNKVFGLFNYGFGSTNILSTEERLNFETTYQGKTLPAILGRQFDVVLIESFGNNPLSEYPLEDGLQKQTAALDHMVAEIVDTHPSSLIVFVATIAPSQAYYGKGAVDLSVVVRNRWANERRAYIENHINYAVKHNIPLINVYEKSIDKDGLTMIKYLNKSNYIHPSNEGVNLISQMIADYFYKNSVLQ
jgi:lysophospholipase L1-like esterase